MIDSYFRSMVALRLGLVFFFLSGAAYAAVTVSGELKKWHKVTLTFDGPEGYNETSTPNPFLDCRMEVSFTFGEKVYVVPGYYAADGDAGATGASSGNKWRAHFAPDEEGEWAWSASFATGEKVAIDRDLPGFPDPSIDGLSDSFSIGPTDKTGRDHRGKGRLRYIGERYLQFAETGEYFLKAGADSPETFLAYSDFDDLRDFRLKTWEAHVQDWQPGDPTWHGSKGKGIIGAINYLSDKGMNVQSFIVMNLRGWTGNVYPFVTDNLTTVLTDNDLLRYDVSRLDQWEIVFEHMDRKGIFMHFKLQEARSTNLLSREERFLFYRELNARFSHHLALNWNFGEEATNSKEEILSFGQEIRDLDPYSNPLVIHTYPGQEARQQIYGRVIEGFLETGSTPYTGFSFQIFLGRVNEVLEYWRNETESVGLPLVLSVDELGPWQEGVWPDINTTSHDRERGDFLWASLLAGAYTETYFGFQYECPDILCQDLRSRDLWWDQCRHAIEFFRKYIRFWAAVPANDLVSGDSYLLRVPGETYIAYMPIVESGEESQAVLDLTEESSDFRLAWFNPQNGGPLIETNECIVGGTSTTLQRPSERDWVALLQVGCRPADYPKTVSPELPSNPTPGTCGAYLRQGQIPTCSREFYSFEENGAMVNVKVSIFDGRFVIRTEVDAEFYIQTIKMDIVQDYEPDQGPPTRTWEWIGKKLARWTYVDPLEIAATRKCCWETLDIPYAVTFCRTSDDVCLTSDVQVFKFKLKCNYPCTALYGENQKCGVCM